MRRTRRNALEEGDTENKKIEEKQNKKRFKKSNNMNNINESRVGIDEEEGDKKSKKTQVISGSEDFKNYIEEIKTKLSLTDYNYEKKPEFIDKPYNIEDPILQKLEKFTKFKLISPIEIYYKIKYEEYHKMSLEEDKCSICQFHFYDEDLRSKSIDSMLKLYNDTPFEVILLNNCSDHFFHLDCLDNLIQDNTFAKCPNCNKIYGIITGDQPKGTMKASLAKYKCSGYNCGSIVIEYNFPGGKNYTGTYRVAYLPDNKEGREVVALLKVAFDRKLLFTIGTSVTTGQEKTTIWNGVHHKTNVKGGSHNYGYPDPTYFHRVKQELASKGVLEENIGESPDEIVKSLGLADMKNIAKKK